MTTDTIYYHLGASHPLHITLYTLMAQLLILKQKWQEAMYLFKAAMICCLKSLGPNHIRTAHLHMSLGYFYQNWAKREHKDQQTQALQHFEQAFMIFQAHH